MRLSTKSVSGPGQTTGQKNSLSMKTYLVATENDTCVHYFNHMQPKLNLSLLGLKGCLVQNQQFRYQSTQKCADINLVCNNTGFESLLNNMDPLRCDLTWMLFDHKSSSILLTTTSTCRTHLLESYSTT